MITKINGVYSLTDEADVLNLPTKGVQIGSLAQLTKDNGDSTVYIFTKDMSTGNTSWVKVPNSESVLTDVEKANVALIPDIKTDIREVNEQLEHKANNIDVFLKTNGININDFDEDTRTAILENNNIDINYVLGENNVKIENLDIPILTKYPNIFKKKSIASLPMTVSQTNASNLKTLTFGNLFEIGT